MGFGVQGYWSFCWWQATFGYAPKVYQIAPCKNDGRKTIRAFLLGFGNFSRGKLAVKLRGRNSCRSPLPTQIGHATDTLFSSFFQGYRDLPRDIIILLIAKAPKQYRRMMLILFYHRQSLRMTGNVHGLTVSYKAKHDTAWGGKIW